MITIEQLEEMFSLQEQLEIRINGPDWRNAGHDYRVCIFMECAEIVDCYPWKHWKDVNADNVDLDKVAMEIVDIWHFGMAFMLMHPQFNVEKVYEELKTATRQFESDLNMEAIAIGMGIAIFVANQFPFGNFVGMLVRARMTFDDLYTLYISKNVLNWFRQDNGYKDGRYLKNWAGREDNEHLQELCEQLGTDMNATSLYNALKTRYSLAVR